MKRFKSKALLWIGAAALLTAAGAWYLFRGRADVEYRTVLVDRGNIAYTISATGSPNAVVTVQVGTQVSGNILALYADFNTKVKKGQLVARIDPQVFESRVTQSSASLEVSKAAVVNARALVQKAQADLANANAGVAESKASVMKAKVAVQDAKNKLDREAVLLRDGIAATQDQETTQATYDTAVAMEQAAEAEQEAALEKVESAKDDVEVAKTQLGSSEAQVKQAQAALEQAQLDLQHTYITAPVDGVVVARHVDVGQTVAASLQTPTLFEIAEDLTKMQVDTNVSEADVGHVKMGQSAVFTVDAYPGEFFRGQVTQIRQAAINVQNVITYDIVIAVSNPDLKLFPGMTANVKILIDRHDNVLRVPNAALRFRPAEAVSVPTGGPERPAGRRGPAPDPPLWVLDSNGEPKSVAVKYGLNDGAYTEIASGGLKEGDRVISASFSKKDASAPTTTPLPAGGRRGPGF